MIRRLHWITPWKDLSIKQEFRFKKQMDLCSEVTQTFYYVLLYAYWPILALHY